MIESQVFDSKTQFSYGNSVCNPLNITYRYRVNVTFFLITFSCCIYIRWFILEMGQVIFDIIPSIEQRPQGQLIETVVKLIVEV